MLRGFCNAARGVKLGGYRLLASSLSRRCFLCWCATAYKHCFVVGFDSIDSLDYLHSCAFVTFLTCSDMFSN